MGDAEKTFSPSSFQEYQVPWRWEWGSQTSRCEVHHHIYGLEFPIRCLLTSLVERFWLHEQGHPCVQYMITAVSHKLAETFFWWCEAVKLQLFLSFSPFLEIYGGLVEGLARIRFLIIRVGLLSVVKFYTEGLLVWISVSRRPSSAAGTQEVLIVSCISSAMKYMWYMLFAIHCLFNMDLVTVEMLLEFFVPILDLEHSREDAVYVTT